MLPNFSSTLPVKQQFPSLSIPSPKTLPRRQTSHTPATPSPAGPPGSPRPTPTPDGEESRANSTHRERRRAPRRATASQAGCPSALQRKRQVLSHGRPRQGPGRPDAAAWRRAIPRAALRRVPFLSPFRPRAAPHSPYNLCSKNTCRHGCASRVENVGIEMVRFLLLRPGTRLERGGVEG